MPQQRARAALGAEPLAPQDHDVLAAVAQQLAASSRRVSAVAAAAAASAAVERGQERGLVAGRVADDSVAFGSSALGRAVAIASLTPWRRTPLRIRRSRIGASSSGSQPTTSTVCANSRSRTVACSAGAASARASSSAPALPLARESTSAEPQRLAHQPREQEALLVGRLPADERADAAPVAGQAGGGLERALPGDLAQLAAVAHQRLGDPLVDVDRLVGEAALVAQPAVVDVLVALWLAGEHPHRPSRRGR